MSYFREQLEQWLSRIDVKTDRVLDVGGGANPVKNRVRNWEVKTYKILDNELEEMKQEPDIVWDLNKKFEKSKFFSNYFDAVFCLEVMEYAWEPYTALLNLNHFLKVNGVLWISFPFLYPHHNPKGNDYLRFTRWGTEKLLKEAGFEILELKSRVMTSKSNGHWSNFVKNEGMHPSRGYKGHNQIGYLVKCKKI